MFPCKECSKKELYIGSVQSSLKLAMDAKECQIKDLVEEVGYLRKMVDRLLPKFGVVQSPNPPEELVDLPDNDEIVRSSVDEAGETTVRYGN